MPARGPVLQFLRRERAVPHVKVRDHAAGGGAVQFVVVVAAEQVHLHQEGERYLQVLEVLVHIVDIEEVAILEDGGQSGFEVHIITALPMQSWPPCPSPTRGTCGSRQTG